MGGEQNGWGKMGILEYQWLEQRAAWSSIYKILKCKCTCNFSTCNVSLPRDSAWSKIGTVCSVQKQVPKAKMMLEIDGSENPGLVRTIGGQMTPFIHIKLCDVATF